LPALAVPAGFSPDGLPVGMDLLGSAYSEERLLSLGYSIERALRRRQPPFSTPPLAGGSTPNEWAAAIAVNQVSTLDFLYDPVTARLQSSWRGASTSLAGISAIWLHSGTPEKPGAARQVVYTAEQGLHRDLTLTHAARHDLAAGQLLVRVYPAPGRQQIRDAALPLEMQRISGNAFVMGTPAQRVDALMTRFGSKRRELFASEVPAHHVTTKSFLIDRTEVTNSAFKRFVDAYPEWLPDRLPANQHNGDYLKHWSDGAYPAGAENHPVTYVTWPAAASFCKSVGKRLPTEVEWEFAAGNGASAEFPWGDSMPDAFRANWSGAKVGAPARVGSFPPVRGLYDMAGNVWEFVEDAWTDNYEPSSKTSSDRRVIRGGSFGGSAVNLRVRYRDSHPALGAGPHVGFRCARPVEEKK
jgi:formylglycine-generating enzyme required for sulfatase activity